MDDQEREQAMYLRALQSPPISVAVPGQEALSVPRELFCWRSNYIRKALHWPKHDPSKTHVDLYDTPQRTVQQFVIWSFSMKPMIDEAATFSDVVDLAIFAEAHGVELLHNQSLDILRHEIGSSTWKITPYIVERIYKSVGEGTNLRKLVGNLLCHARVDVSGEGPHESMETWCEVFETNSDIGRDYYRSTCEKRTIKQIKEGGPCRFHWHRGISEKELASVDGTCCPYVYAGQFPIGVADVGADATGKETVCEDQETSKGNG